jgi:hypothetical protein
MGELPPYRSSSDLMQNEEVNARASRSLALTFQAADHLMAARMLRREGQSNPYAEPGEKAPRLSGGFLLRVIRYIDGPGTATHLPNRFDRMYARQLEAFAKDLVPDIEVDLDTYTA